MANASGFRFWVVIPAAGSSRRVGGDIPKQYLRLAGRSVIEWSLAPFLSRADCAGVVGVLARDDVRWKELAVAGWDESNQRKIRTTFGGEHRSDSVRAGLLALADDASAQDWIAVHDAARPCLRAADLDRLIVSLQDDPVGGLLAARVADTLKRAGADARVQETVSREALWRALTPQMFRYGVLKRALEVASEKSQLITDEAQAVELLGLRPRLIEGSADNIKITVPGDLSRAQRILETSTVGSDSSRPD
jgi:2-C-methyl-D-erythritol 4-phosphate cytidylyltransferase